MRLISPTIDLKEEAVAFFDELIKDNKAIQGGAMYENFESYEAWLESLVIYENKETVPVGKVCATTYFLEDNNIIYGVVNIRHELNDYLRMYGGNIGYSIRPKNRRQGYGSIMLSKALEICKNLGLEKALVTCYKTNLGSAGVIKNNGGILDSEIDDEGKILQRYWVPIK